MIASFPMREPMGDNSILAAQTLVFTRRPFLRQASTRPGDDAMERGELSQ